MDLLAKLSLRSAKCRHEADLDRRLRQGGLHQERQREREARHSRQHVSLPVIAVLKPFVDLDIVEGYLIFARSAEQVKMSPD